jgi:putative endonuclease
MYFVYILTNSNDTVLYIGVTNDILRRVLEHRDELVPGFTAKYCLKKLVYYEAFEDHHDAFRRERQLKNWHREWKENLIRKVNNSFRDLFDELVEKFS